MHTSKDLRTHTKKSRPTYTLETRAKAMELLREGNTITNVAQQFHCGVATISRWYLSYLGYRGEEGTTITQSSKMNNMINIEDN